MQKFKHLEDDIRKKKMRKKNMTHVILDFKRAYPDSTLREIEFFVLGYKLAQRG